MTYVQFTHEPINGFYEEIDNEFFSFDGIPLTVVDQNKCELKVQIYDVTLNGLPQKGLRLTRHVQKGEVMCIMR